MKYIDFTFKPLSAMSQFIQATPPKGVFKSATLQSNDTGDHFQKFTDTATLDEANNLMLGGWQAGVDKVAAYMSKNKAGRRGFAPCVPAYLSGNPLNMYNQKQAPSRKRIISITYNNTVNSGVSAEEIQQAAAKLFNVIVGLEKQGVSTELYICTIAQRDGEQIFWSTCIKQAARPFNLLSAVYPFTHPSMLRRQGFAIIERAGVREKGWQRTYGQAITYSTAKECKRVGIPAENVFSYDILKDKSEKEIAEMLK